MDSKDHVRISSTNNNNNNNSTTWNYSNTLGFLFAIVALVIFLSMLLLLLLTKWKCVEKKKSICEFNLKSLNRHRCYYYYYLNSDSEWIFIWFEFGNFFSFSVCFSIYKKSKVKKNGILLFGLCESGKTLIFARLVFNKFIQTHTSIKENLNFYSTGKVSKVT